MKFKCKYFLKNNVENCLICAIKPLIYVGFTVIYIGRPKCPHSCNTYKPRIEETVWNTYLARICNFFIIADIIFVAVQLGNSQHLLVSSKYYCDIILPNFINTLNYTFCFLLNNSIYINYTNGFIALIDKRKFFGIHSVLTKKITIRLQLWSWYCVCIIFLVNIVFLVTIVPKELCVESFLLIISLTVNNVNALLFAFYGVTTLIVYKALFKACYEAIQKTLETSLSKEVLVKISLQKKLQFHQQFYLTICSNYKKHVYGFCTILFYTGQFVFTIFSVVQAYFFMLEPSDPEGYWYKTFSNFFHIFVAVMTSVICTQLHSITVLSHDLISFLYKYQINKLSTVDALQVEILLTTLQTEKPILTASNLYLLGTNLLASASGTAVTYVMVALQFYSSFSTYYSVRTE